jgi:Na+/phosphate symporter
MAEKSGESAVGKYLGAPIGGALTALLTRLTAGSTGVLAPALISLFAVAGGLCGLPLTLIYRRYLDILGADRRRPAERQALQRSRLKENPNSACHFRHCLSP